MVSPAVSASPQHIDAVLSALHRHSRTNELLTFRNLERRLDQRYTDEAIWYFVRHLIQTEHVGVWVKWPLPVGRPTAYLWPLYRVIRVPSSGNYDHTFDEEYPISPPDSYASLFRVDNPSLAHRAVQAASKSSRMVPDTTDTLSKILKHAFEPVRVAARALPTAQSEPSAPRPPAPTPDQPPTPRPEQPPEPDTNPPAPDPAPTAEEPEPDVDTEEGLAYRVLRGVVRKSIEQRGMGITRDEGVKALQMKGFSPDEAEMHMSNLGDGYATESWLEGGLWPAYPHSPVNKTEQTRYFLRTKGNALTYDEADFQAMNKRWKRDNNNGEVPPEHDEEILTQ